MSVNELFKDTEREFVLLPINQSSQFFGYALVLFLVLGQIALLSMVHISVSIMFERYPYMATVYLIFVFLLILFFYNVSNKEIIFDKHTKQVFSKTIFRKKLLSSFSNIENISIAIDRGLTLKKVGFYRMLMKDDIYGSGVRLSKTSGLESKQLEIFKTEILPRLIAVLS